MRCGLAIGGIWEVRRAQGGGPPARVPIPAAPAREPAGPSCPLDPGRVGMGVPGDGAEGQGSYPPASSSASPAPARTAGRGPAGRWGGGVGLWWAVYDFRLAYVCQLGAAARRERTLLQPPAFQVPPHTHMHAGVPSLSPARPQARTTATPPFAPPKGTFMMADFQVLMDASLGGGSGVALQVSGLECRPTDGTLVMAGSQLLAEGGLVGARAGARGAGESPPPPPPTHTHSLPPQTHTHSPG